MADARQPALARPTPAPPDANADPLAPDPLQALWTAVRRHLLRVRAARALRQALIGSAVLLGLALPVHLLLLRVPGGWLSMVMAAAMAAWLARALWHHPAPAELAVWADRHLDGQSAFGTWFDLRRGPAWTADPRAGNHLRHAVMARLPAALDRLHALPSPWRLARPLGGWLVVACTAALGWSLDASMHRPAAVTAAEPVAPPPAAAASRTLGDTTPDSGAAGQLLQALRSPRATGTEARGDRASGRTGGGDPPAAGRSAEARDGRPPRDAVAMGPVQAGTDANPATARREPPREAGDNAAAVAGAGNGSGAGDHADREPGVRRPPAAGAPRAAAVGTRPDATSPGRRADATEAGLYDESAVAGPHGRAPQAVQAAIPPAATAIPVLTPSESNYVQAWLKAIARSR